MSRDANCIILAMLFSAVFVVPPILVYGDRSLPFEYVHVYPAKIDLHPNEQTHNVFVVTDVKKPASGRYHRWFTDSKGHRTFLGTFQANYQQGLSESGKRTFNSPWQVPPKELAYPGPGLYESYPEFWHNPLQGQVNPVTPPQPVRVKVNILPPEN